MDSFIDPGLLVSNARQSPRPDKIGKTTDPAKIRAKAQEFEAIFVHSMLKSMRASIPDSGLMEGGSQRQIFQDLMDMEIARQTTQRNPTAITEGLVRQLSSQNSSLQTTTTATVPGQRPLDTVTSTSKTPPERTVTE